MSRLYFSELIVIALFFIPRQLRAQEKIFSLPDTVLISAHCNTCSEMYLLYSILPNRNKLHVGKFVNDSLVNLGTFECAQKFSYSQRILCKGDKLFIDIEHPDSKEKSLLTYKGIPLQKEGNSLVMLDTLGHYLGHNHYMNWLSGYTVNTDVIESGKRVYLTQSMREGTKAVIQKKTYGKKAQRDFYVLMRFNKKFHLKKTVDGSNFYKTSFSSNLIQHQNKVYQLISTCCKHEADYHFTTALSEARKGKEFYELLRNSNYLLTYKEKLVFYQIYPFRLSVFDFRTGQQEIKAEFPQIESSEFQLRYSSAAGNQLTLLFAQVVKSGLGSSRVMEKVIFRGMLINMEDFSILKETEFEINEIDKREEFKIVCFDFDEISMIDFGKYIRYRIN